MATQKVVVEGSDVSASQLHDLFRQFADGSLKKVHLQAFLEHRDPWAPITEVTLGVYKTARAYWSALGGMPCNIGSLYLFPGGIPLAQEKIKLSLAYVSVEDLGFKKRTPYKDICKAAQKRGYQLCPAEVGLALRLACKNQREGEWFGIGMEPDPDYGYVYVLGCEAPSYSDEDLEYILSVQSTKEMPDLKPDHELVFVKP